MNFDSNEMKLNVHLVCHFKFKSGPSLLSIRCWDWRKMWMMIAWERCSTHSCWVFGSSFDKLRWRFLFVNFYGRRVTQKRGHRRLLDLSLSARQWNQLNLIFSLFAATYLNKYRNFPSLSHAEDINLMIFSTFFASLLSFTTFIKIDFQLYCGGAHIIP